jgi:hypothetical protein
MATWGGVKTDYQNTDPVTNADVNRRETNLDYLKDEADSIRTDFDQNINQGLKTTDPVTHYTVTGTLAINTPRYDLAAEPAFQRPIAGSTYLVCRIQESEEPATLTGYRDPGENKGSDIGHHLGVNILVKGVLRFSVEHEGTLGQTSTVRILKNGVQVNEWSQLGTWITRVQDISVDIGDVIIFQHKTTGGVTARWRNLLVYSGVKTFACA